MFSLFKRNDLYKREVYKSKPGQQFFIFHSIFYLMRFILCCILGGILGMFLRPIYLSIF